MVLQNIALNTFSWRGVGREATLSLIKQSVNVVGEADIPPSGQAL